MEENVFFFLNIFLGHCKDLSGLNEGAVKRVSFHHCSRDWKVADGKSRRRGIRQMTDVENDEMSSSQLEPKGKLGQSMALVNSLCSSTAFTTCPEHEPSHDISYISSRRWRCVMLRYLWFTLLSRRCGGAALALVTQLLQRHDVDFANIVELPNWYKCLVNPCHSHRTDPSQRIQRVVAKLPPVFDDSAHARLPSDHQTKASEGLGDELSRWGWW